MRKFTSRFEVSCILVVSSSIATGICFSLASDFWKGNFNLRAKAVATTLISGAVCDTSVDSVSPFVDALNLFL